MAPLRPLVMQRIQAAVFVLGAVVVLLGGAATGGSKASYTDVATSSSVFTAGSVNISLLNGSGTVTCSTAGGYSDSITAVLSSTGNLAGAVATGGVCIKHEGSLTSRWSLSSSISDDATGGLEAVSKIRFWSLNNTGSSSATACTDGFTATGTDVTLTGGGQTNFGAELYTSALLSTDPSIATSANTETSTGGFMKLCFSVVLPSTVTDSSLSNKTLTMNFTITGNQT